MCIHAHRMQLTACAAGTAACAKDPTTCAAWVYVSDRGAMKGPRCALKGKNFCPPVAHANTISGAMPGEDTTAHCGSPPPTPPSPLPPGWVGGKINGGLVFPSSALVATFGVFRAVLCVYCCGITRSVPDAVRAGCGASRAALCAAAVHSVRGNAQ